MSCAHVITVLRTLVESLIGRDEVLARSVLVVCSRGWWCVIPFLIPSCIVVICFVLCIFHHGIEHKTGMEGNSLNKVRLDCWPALGSLLRKRRCAGCISHLSHTSPANATQHAQRNRWQGRPHETPVHAKTPPTASVNPDACSGGRMHCCFCGKISPRSISDIMLFGARWALPYAALHC